MPKVTLIDCIKQIIAINKELDDLDGRNEGHMMFIIQLRDRIEKLEKEMHAKEKM